MLTNKVDRYKIHIGNHPKSDRFGKSSVNKYDAILNVSDYPQYWPSRKTLETNWCPIVEWDQWGYAPLYWTVHTLDRLIKNKKNIYVHCWAGKHRSPMVVYLYIQSLGYSQEEAFKMFDMQFVPKFKGDSRPIGNWLKKFQDRDIEKGRIPKDAISFMKLVRKYPTKSVLQILEILKKKKIKGEFHIILGKK